MLKRICIIIMVVVLAMCITACTNPFDPDKPKLNTIKEICELETLTVKCNDVIKAEKKAGEGWQHILEKDREYWVEYTGVVKMGVNADDIEVKVRNDKVFIDLPEVEVLDVHIDEGSISEDSIYVSNDGILNPNKISAEDQTEIIDKAQKQLETAFEEDEDIKSETTQATKRAIETYVDKLGDSFEVNYQIVWK